MLPHSHFNLVWTETLQSGVCCVSVSVYNFNPNSPDARVRVCVSVAESVSSPDSSGASHTSQLAKRRASDYSRQMPNLILLTDPFIYGWNISNIN